VLELADSFREVFERHGEVEGLVADLLARRQQEKFLASQQSGQDSPGCLLGWIMKGRRPRP